MKTALYPGSFDPVTVGHMDMISRAAKLCDTLIVAVMHNPDKRGAMRVESRVKALCEATAHIPNVRVISSRAMLVDLVDELGADLIVKGIRNEADYAYEQHHAVTYTDDALRSAATLSTRYIQARFLQLL